MAVQPGLLIYHFLVSHRVDNLLICSASGESKKEAREKVTPQQLNELPAARSVSRAFPILRPKSIIYIALLPFSPSDVCALARTNTSAPAVPVRALPQIPKRTFDTSFPAVRIKLSLPSKHSSARWLLRVRRHLEKWYDVIVNAVAALSAQHESVLLATDHGLYPDNVAACRSRRNKL